MAGVVAGSRELVGKLRREVLPYLGAKLSPFDAWLLLRGLRTLPARMREHERSALALATRLQSHPAVTACITRRCRSRARRASKGHPACSRSELAPSIDIPAFCNALKLFKLGVSWGGHESLICPAGVTRVQTGGPNHALRFGVPERMVRLNTGLEATEIPFPTSAQAFDASKT